MIVAEADPTGRVEVSREVPAESSGILRFIILWLSQIYIAANFLGSSKVKSIRPRPRYVEEVERRTEFPSVTWQTAIVFLRKTAIDGLIEPTSLSQKTRKYLSR
jgi:hypothetical protein